MTKLRISDDVQLPEDAVTRTFVVYGGKGKGKTNFGSVLVEELSKRRLRFCVTDPLDVWWGLQHGKTKDAQGIDVAILGGKHGDIPIDPAAGEVIADFVADEDVSTVIVMRHADGVMWSNGERIRFMTAFVRRLFARQGERRRPLMLVIDEAGRFVPQNPGKGDVEISKCIGAIEELVEWGRNVGLGCCLITQRSARMNKSVSELAECMVAFQTAGPNSISAIVDWFGEHIEKARQNELIAILRKLPVGRALLVSPEWLAFEGEAQIRLRETFDSSATPKAGGALRAPGRARKPDLAKYQARMADVAERAKAADPSVLRAQSQAKDRRIAELEKKVGALEARPAAAAPAKTQRVEVAVLKNGSLTKLRHISEQWVRAGAAMLEAEQTALQRMQALQGLAGELRTAIAPVRDELARITRDPAPTGGASTAAVEAPPVRAGAHEEPSRQTRPTVARESEPSRTYTRHPGGSSTPARTEGISRPQQRILDALLWIESTGLSPRKRNVVANLADASAKSSGFEKNISTLSTSGLIRYPAPGLLALTDEGRAAANPPFGALTASELQSEVFKKVSGPQGELLGVLIREYPGMLTREELAEKARVSAKSSGFEKNVSTLSSFGWIHYPDRGHVAATPDLFLEGRP